MKIRSLCCNILVGLLSALIAIATLLEPTTYGQELAPQADAADQGILLANVPPKPGNDLRVLLPSETGEPVVGKVYMESGNRYVVQLPSGRLTSVVQSEVTATDRPFQGWKADEMIDHLTKEKFKGFKSKSTKHYVYIYNTSEEFATATSRILESMYPSLIKYCEKKGLKVTEPAAPLPIIMFATEDEYQKYQKMPEGVIAYYNGVSNFVIMYEKSKLVEVAPTIAFKQAVSTIAHEGVHQILHNVGIQDRLVKWPMWISEGIPEFFAPTDVGQKVRWKGVGLTNDLRLYSLIEQYKKNPASFGSGELIEKTISAPMLDSDGYAAAWAITFYLAKFKTKAFDAFLVEAADAKPWQPLGDSKELFVKHFGADFADIEKEMIERLSKMPYVDPIENQPHYVVYMRLGIQRAYVISPSPKAISEWQQGIIAGLPPAERANVQFAAEIYGNKQLATQAARANSMN